MALRPLSKPVAIAGPGPELAPSRGCRLKLGVHDARPHLYKRCADASEFRRDDLSNMLSDLIAACYHDACVVIIIMECALWVGPRGRMMRKPKHDVTSTDK